MSNAVCTYDFTTPECDRTIIQNWINDNCKKWCYQLEEGESGYKHYQGRVSLKIKERLTGVIKGSKGIIHHWSITSNENRDNNFYVCKDETRIDGPWKDNDPKPVYIPRQFRIDSLLPWQQYIVDHYDDWDSRCINIVYDPEGHKGKSVLVGYMCTSGLSQKIPYCNDYRDIMRMIMGTNKKRIYLIDLPKALGKDKLATFMSGIETLKDGYCYDDRYHFKEEWFDSPNVWMFTNKIPDQNLLSKDRWKYWQISNTNLVSYDPRSLSVEIENIYGASL